MPIDNLKDLKKHFDSIVFVSYLTVQPDKESVNEYVNQMKQELEDETTQLWYIGRMIEHIDTTILSDSMSVFNSIESLVEAV
jgi:predicted DNA-binding ArsR family transcriptional regulator